MRPGSAGSGPAARERGRFLTADEILLLLWFQARAVVPKAPLRVDAGADEEQEAEYAFSKATSRPQRHSWDLRISSPGCDSRPLWKGCKRLRTGMPTEAYQVEAKPRLRGSVAHAPRRTPAAEQAKQVQAAYVTIYMYN